MNRRGNSQNGNVFFIIFLAIALFAALSYAVSLGSRSGAANLTSDQARLASSEILAYADSVNKAVQTLRLRGCTETQINFAPEFSQTNPLAPSDKSCDVFDLNGGKVNYIAPNANWLANTSYVHWWFNAQTAVTNIGTAKPELIFWLLNLKPEICTALNQKLMSKDPQIENVGTHTVGFDGTYNIVGGDIGDDSAGDIYAGASQGCLFPSGGNFYSVLIAR